MGIILFLFFVLVEMEYRVRAVMNVLNKSDES